MKSSLRTRSTRVLAAGAVSVALLTVGTVGASAATTPSPSPKMTTPGRSPKMPADSTPTKPMSPSPTGKRLAAKPKRAPKPAAAATTTVKASKTEVKAGEPVKFTVRASGLRIGTDLVLQRFNGKAWTTVKTIKVKKGTVYSVTIKPAGKGAQKYRVTHGKTHSPTVMVTVK